ncbi:MAG TPA: BON domain-containing protein [Rhodospirillaceae bacterium]|nr:BON domain-containing protein [Rhodospirillaceae bacterium]
MVIRPLFIPASLMFLLISVTACDPVTGSLISGAAAVGTGSVQERGLESAVDDTKIRASINSSWLENDWSLFSDISTSVTEGRVLLTGSVKKPESRIEAVRLAWQAAGVRQVIDEIQVTDQSGFFDFSRDVWIANNLRTRLMFDQQIRNINYTVDVVNGVVYLMGIARSPEELDKVIAHARNIDNVKRVVNHVLLKTDPHRQSM